MNWILKLFGYNLERVYFVSYVMKCLGSIDISECTASTDKFDLQDIRLSIQKSKNTDDDIIILNYKFIKWALVKT